jgi:hypothetical protein
LVCLINSLKYQTNGGKEHTVHAGKVEQHQQVPLKPGSSHCLTHFNTTALGMNGDTTTISNANRSAVIGLATNINESFDDNYIM